MSKVDCLKRYINIIQCIQSHKNGYPSRKDIIDFLENRKDVKGLSERTFRHDIEDIPTIFGIEIKYNSQERGYYIPNNDNNPLINILLESFEIVNSFGGYKALPDFIIPEKQRSRGLQHLIPLKKAIEESILVAFNYKKFYPEIEQKRKIKPYALKESRGRWYLLGIDYEKEHATLKSFGLDRIDNLEISTIRFKKEIELEVLIKNYDHSFAMFTDGEPERVILSFDLRDGKYVEAMPIHKSQIITYKNDRVQVELYICITLDFIMELMSRSWSLEIIKPISLRERMHKIYLDAAERNK